MNGSPGQRNRRYQALTPCFVRTSPSPRRERRIEAHGLVGGRAKWDEKERLAHEYACRCTAKVLAQFAFAFSANTPHVPTEQLDALRAPELWLPIVADSRPSPGDLRAMSAPIRPGTLRGTGHPGDAADRIREPAGSLRDRPTGGSPVGRTDRDARGAGARGDDDSTGSNQAIPVGRAQPKEWSNRGRERRSKTCVAGQPEAWSAQTARRVRVTLASSLSCIVTASRMSLPPSVRSVLCSAT